MTLRNTARAIALGAALLAGAGVGTAAAKDGGNAPERPMAMIRLSAMK